MMWISFSIVTIPGERYRVLTTSDSGWVYNQAKLVEATNGLAEINPWSHAPYGLEFEPQQLQSILAVMMYRAAHTLDPSITLMDITLVYAPLLFCFTLVPVYLVAREFGGRLAGVFAVFLMATMVSTIYWHKVGAFDREPTITLFSAWSFYALVRLFKSDRKTIFRESILCGLVLGLFFFSWGGALFIVAAFALGLFLVLLLSFGGKLIKHFDDIYGAAFHAFRSHLNFISACVVAFIIATIGYVGISSASPIFLISFSQMILSYVGIPLGGKGAAAPPRYATEMQPPKTLGEVFGSFYRDPLITNIVLTLMGITLLLCLWKRKREHLLLLSIFIVLTALVWPGKGQARFERVWWPFVPVMAGLGAATLLRWLRDLSFDPNWEWLKMLQRPLLILAAVLFFSSGLLVNAFVAAERTTPPPEWHWRGLDPALMDAFEWIKANTTENDIISIQWSFGHLLAGATGRMTVVDGSETAAQKGTWESDPSYVPRPPDYIWFLRNNRKVYYGVDEGARPYTVNGRRPDVQFFPYMSEDELRWYLKTYRDNFGVRIDYLIFTADEEYNASFYHGRLQLASELLKMEPKETTANIGFQDDQIIVNFAGGKRVIVDQAAERAYLESGGTRRELDGFVFLIYNPRLFAGRRFDYTAEVYTSPSPQVNDAVLLFVSGNRITQAQLVDRVSDKLEQLERPVALRGAEVEFLERVFANRNVKIYKVNHAVIT
jgi:hypothetical protein